MTDSNRTQLLRVREATLGTTPASPEMEKVRLTGETLAFGIDNIRSEEIRSDRLTTDLIQVGARVNGGFNFELSHEAFDPEIESAFMNTFSKVAEIENSAADTEIGAVTDSSDTYTVASGGAAFKAGHLCRATGFTNSENNIVFKVDSSTSTTVVAAGTPTLADEAAPPKGAKLKSVGFEGGSGDITATATGLGSSTLDFTTLGLTVGQWIKIGGTATADKFATAALNTWARITAIAANALTLDNLPSAWTTDSGTGKTIQVWFGDTLKIGTTKIGHTYEKAVLSQDTVAYRSFKGCLVNQLELSISTNALITGSVDLLGFDEDTNSSTVANSTVEAPQNDVLSAVTNVGRIAENGTSIASPNFAQRLGITINNNLREQNAIGTLGLVGVGVGDADVSFQIDTYFGDSTLYDKYVAGTSTNLNSRVAKNNKAYVFTLPNVKFESAEANSSGRNQDVQAVLTGRGLRDSATETSLQLDSFAYYEE